MHKTAPFVARLAIACTALLGGVGVGCKDSAKISAAAAAEHVTMLTPIVEKDVAEVERGLPEGAKRVGTALFAKGADPKADPLAVRSALRKARRDVMDLNQSKATFLALTDDKGVAIRNDLEEDVMAGQELGKIFPEILKAQSGAFVVTTGAFPSAANSKNGPDKDYVAASPIKRDDGSVGGILVTGWSYRYFARHLSEVLKNDLLDKAKANGQEGRIPVFYVALFEKSGVYSAPLTPAVNEKALSEIDLVGKTAAPGVASGTVTITERPFGWAATRTPKLGPDVGVVVLRSEL